MLQLTTSISRSLRRCVGIGATHHPPRKLRKTSDRLWASLRIEIIPLRLVAIRRCSHVLTLRPQTAFFVDAIVPLHPSAGGLANAHSGDTPAIEEPAGYHRPPELSLNALSPNGGNRD